MWLCTPVLLRRLRCRFLYITGVSDVRVHIPLLIMWGVVCDVLGYSR
ncbi:hypothetical protein HMPREF9343_01310 [Cutibacterium acnes HL099PA1]|nr:hypothetical protein HMPREF9343_01310 [Cutibacterium acnes HL099PA1]